MKVCFFNSITSWGGGEKWHFETAVGLVGKGVKVCAIVGKNGVLESRLKSCRIPARSLIISNFSFLNPFKIFALYAYLKREKVDLVLFNSSRDAKIGILAAMFAGVRTTVYRRGSPTPIKFSLINKFIVNRISCILCNSEATSLSVIGRKSWIDPGKVFVIYNGVSIPSIEKIAKCDRQQIIIGAAGRLFHEKGHRFLIEALALLDKTLDIELHLAGDGKLMAELEQQVIDLGLTTKVKFLGFVEDMPSFYSSLDIFVMPSVWEGFGFALVEAMLYSKPVVAFNTGSIPEIVTDGEDGFIVPFSDVAALSQKIDFLINNKVKREQMGMTAKQNAARFSSENALARLELLFHELVGVPSNFKN